jgi:heat shock protein HslJ
MRPTVTVLLVALTATAIVAAAAFAQSPPLAGSEWRPTEIDGVEIAEDAGIFIQFGAEGKVQGSGGCNRFTGKYEVDGDTIALGPLATTRMLCPDPVQQNEDRLFAGLARATKFAREGIDLTLKDDEDAVVVQLVQTDAD